MWTELTNSGKTRFVERFENPITGKDMKVSITVKKVTKAIEKEMPFMLQEKFEEKIAKMNNDKIKVFTIEKISKEWLKLQKERVKKSTYTTNRYSLKHFNQTFGNQLLSEIRHDEVNKYFLDKLKNKQINYATAKRMCGLFKRIVKYAYKYEGINRLDLVNLIDIPKINLPKKNDLKYLTTEELNVIFNFFENEKRFEELRLIKIQVSTGMRFNEVVSLMEKDIDFENNSIHVSRNYDPYNKIFTTPKTGDERTIYFNQSLSSVLKEQILVAKMKAVRFNHDRENLLLFARRNGLPILITTFNYHLKKVGIANKTVSTHIFRHTYITKAVESGVSKDIIARQVGHSDTKMIDKVYAHFTKEMEEKQKEAMLDFKII